jgi:hypothetical protein
MHFTFPQISQFASDSLYMIIHKSRHVDANAADKDSVFSFDVEIKSIADKPGLAVFVFRHSGQLNLTIPIAAQVFVCQVNDAAPLGLLIINRFSGFPLVTCFLKCFFFFFFFFFFF